MEYGIVKPVASGDKLPYTFAFIESIQMFVPTLYDMHNATVNKIVPSETTSCLKFFISQSLYRYSKD